LQNIPDLGNLRQIETFIRRVSANHGAAANRARRQGRKRNGQSK
jgi:hypothetical protein